MASFIVGSLLLPFQVAWEGFVAATLWRWFVVPALGAPPISVPVAVGLSCLLLTVIPGRSGSRCAKCDDDDEWRGVKAALLGALLSATALGIGWCAKGFMQ